MDEKKCNDCTYFREYYTKMKTRFYKTDKGFCGNFKPNGHSRKTDKTCECYMLRDLKSEKEKWLKYLTDYLAEVSKRLNDIKEVLKDDN